MSLDKLGVPEEDQTILKGVGAFTTLALLATLATCNDQVKETLGLTEPNQIGATLNAEPQATEIPENTLATPDKTPLEQ